jgi:enamine deaminase RidA (YjgF/YER057c/UK114 family)
VIQRFPDRLSKSFSRITTLDLGSSLLVFVAGNVGVPPEGPALVVAEKFEDEVRLCFENIAIALAEVNGVLTDLVKINAFLKSAADYPVYNSVREELLAGALPASATVIVADLLVNARLEIDGTAVVKKR